MTVMAGDVRTTGGGVTSDHRQPMGARSGLNKSTDRQICLRLGGRGPPGRVLSRGKLVT
jgi:hypothetical protein